LLARFCLGGEVHHFNTSRQILSRRTTEMIRSGRFAFVARRRDLWLRGEFSCRPEHMVNAARRPSAPTPWSVIWICSANGGTVGAGSCSTGFKLAAAFILRSAVVNAIRRSSAIVGEHRAMHGPGERYAGGRRSQPGELRDVRICELATS